VLVSSPRRRGCGERPKEGQLFLMKRPQIGEDLAKIAYRAQRRVGTLPPFFDELLRADQK
jgi:hypothetical protein